MKEVIDRLLTIKSIVTLMLTVVFCVLCLRGRVSQEFMTIYTVVIAFYFSSQIGDKKKKEDGRNESP